MAYTKEQQKEYRRKHYLANRDKYLAQSKAWIDNNRDKQNAYVKTWNENNKDKKKEYEKAWAKNNKDKINSYTAKRRASKLQRTPVWSDTDKIAQFYATAKRIEELTGVVHHVDHRIPLQGELVSGLHVPLNLQVISAEANLAKSNTYRI